MSSLQSCYLIPTIDKPTRVRSSFATLIVNIFINNPDQVVTCGNIVSNTRRSKIVSRATGRRGVTSADHSRCAVVLKEIQRYHGPDL